MYKHRAMFVTVWSLLAIALAAFPGFEIRGLAMGLIIGWWPFPMLELLTGDGTHEHPIVQLIVMFLLSGATVGLCAWLVDIAHLSKKVWFPLAFAIIAGAFFTFAINDFDFEDWKNSAPISAAMESSELNYEPTHWDFYKSIVIPRTLAGGMWGLYVAVALSSLCSASAIFLSKKRHT